MMIETPNMTQDLSMQPQSPTIIIQSVLRHLERAQPFTAKVEEERQLKRPMKSNGTNSSCDRGWGRGRGLGGMGREQAIIEAQVPMSSINDSQINVKETGDHQLQLL